MGLHPSLEHNSLRFNGFLSKRAGAAAGAAAGAPHGSQGSQVLHSLQGLGSLQQGLGSLHGFGQQLLLQPARLRALTINASIMNVRTLVIGTPR